MGGVTRSSRHRLLAALAGVGLAWGVVHVALSPASDPLDPPWGTAVLGLLVGWSFVGTGLFAWWRRPHNRTGLLMVAAGFGWLATELSASDDDLVYTIGIALDGVFAAIVGHLLLAFPTGRLQTRAERLVVLTSYFTVTVLQVPSLLFERPDQPRNLLIVHADQPLSDRLDALQYAVAVVLLVASMVIIVRRDRSGAAQRVALRPVLWTGGAAFAAFGVAKGFDAAGAQQDALDWLAEALVTTVPFGFLAGLLRSRLAQGAAMSELLARLGEA